MELQGFIILIKYRLLIQSSSHVNCQATVQPTIGLLPIPRNPIIST